MKTTLSILLTIFSFPIFGCQTTSLRSADPHRSDLQYVIEIEDLSSEQIYSGIKLWVAENFKSAKRVIDYEDEDKGIIICNGILSNIILKSGLVTLPQQAEFKMKIEAKDGKARLTFSDYKIVTRNNSSLYETEVVQIDDKLKSFESRIIKYLKTDSADDF